MRAKTGAAFGGEQGLLFDALGATGAWIVGCHTLCGTGFVCVEEYGAFVDSDVAFVHTSAMGRKALVFNTNVGRCALPTRLSALVDPAFFVGATADFAGVSGGAK